MDKYSTDCFIWIIRSAGERTTDVCKDSILKLFPEAQITIISETPFSKAVIKTMELGKNSGKKWTVCLDADVILQGSGMRELLNFVVHDESVFCYQGLILDKFIPIKRPAGIHVYHNELCERAIKFIPEDNSSLRPESYMTMKMSAIGFKTMQTPFVIGVHDFGQYYIDIFKKAMLHANKHKEVISKVENYWNEKRKSDKDFEVAIAGALAGKLFTDQIKVDKEFWLEQTKKYLKYFEIKEKQELYLSSDEMEIIEKDFQRMETKIDLQRSKNEYFRSFFYRFQEEPRIKNNSFRNSGYLFANLMIKLGRKIQ